MIYYDDDFELSPTSLGCDTKICFWDEDTLGAAERFYDKGFLPCCLNFASHKRPGGGYKSVMDVSMPIKTQEEDLFRRSNLPGLMDNRRIRKYYPLKNLQGLYCSVFMVQKDAKLKKLEKPFYASLIIIPAVVRPKPEQENLVKAKIRRILEIAADQQQRTLVLGAWGCGVFGNDPRLVAGEFGRLLRGEFDGVFENVVFAIPGKDSENYKLFEEVIC